MPVAVLVNRIEQKAQILITMQFGPFETHHLALDDGTTVKPRRGTSSFQYEVSLPDFMYFEK